MFSCDNVKSDKVKYSDFPLFSKFVLNAIKNNPSKINYYYIKFKCDLIKKLGSNFSNLDNEFYKLIFSNIVAYKIKPYGPSHCLDLKCILSNKMLNCVNYSALVWHFYQLMHPNKKIHFVFVGWNGGAVSNHVQVFVFNRDTGLLLDPTIGLIAKTFYDHVASGKPISPVEIFSSYSRHDIDSFNEKVIHALLNGSYKPSDLLYYFENFKLYDNSSGMKEYHRYWATPQANKL